MGTRRNNQERLSSLSLCTRHTRRTPHVEQERGAVPAKLPRCQRGAQQHDRSAPADHAIFLPPITVLLKRGVDIHLIINIILWILLFWIGGVLHAWYIVFVTEGSLLDKK